MQIVFFFYQNLYKQLLLPNNTSFSFLQNLPKLSLQNNNLLTSPITLKEIIDLVKTLPNNKTPEPDKITYEFYKIFIHSLGPSMIKFFNQILLLSFIPSSWKESSIILIPKKSLDKHLIQNW